MLLRSLAELHGNLVMAGRLLPAGYQTKPVQFFVDLDRDGCCVAITDAGPKGEPCPVPDIGRQGTNAPAFPCVDNAQYVLGISKTSSDKPAKAEAARSNYLGRLAETIDALTITDPSTATALAAVEQFVADPDLARSVFAKHGITFEPDQKGVIKAASSRIMFRVDGIDPTEAPALQDWWAAIAEQDLASGTEGICQITGEATMLVKKLPGVSVKRGTPQALISANFAAAERYNAKQSSGAQLGIAAASRSHQSFNWLLTDKHHHRLVGELTFVWWLDSNLEFDAFNIVLEPNPDDVESLLRSPWTGRPGVSPLSLFRLLIVSLTEARIVVRADHVSSLADIENRLRRWLTAIAQPSAGGRTWWPSIGHMAGVASPPGDGAARRNRKDRAIGALARSAFTGQPLPRWLLAATVDRTRIEPIPRNGKQTDFGRLGARNALFTLYRSLQEDTMTDQRSLLCGRLLAVLESAQCAALDDPNRTIVDRYYSAASLNPSRVFPNLVQGLNAHLSKVGRKSDKKGLQITISKRVGTLMGELLELGGFPAALTLEHQADFALGYWDERQTRFNKTSTASTGDPTDEEQD